MFWRRFLPLLFLSFIAVPVHASAQTGAPVLTSVKQAHDLSPQQARRASVRLKGTITYYDPSELVMFLQDATGGIFVQSVHPFKNLHAGDLVELSGKTQPSYRTEIAPTPKIRILGNGGSFPARIYTYDELVNGGGDSTLVKVQGTVQAANVEQHLNRAVLHMDIAMDGGSVELYVADSSKLDPAALLDANVEFTAVAGGSFDAQDQLNGLILYMQDSSSFRVLSPAPVNAWKLPSTEIGNIFQTLRTAHTSPRLRVRGTVIFYEKGQSLVLEDRGESLYVETRDTADIVVGDVVDVIGFASNREYSPSLQLAEIAKTGLHRKVEPLPVSYDEAKSGRHSNDLISLTGTLVSQLNEAAAHTLAVNVDGHLVNALLDSDLPMVQIPVGSRLRLTGICRITTGGPWRAPRFFRLELRNTEDVTILAQPSWWTVRHLTALLAAVLLLALGVALWVLMLRRRLAQQATRIETSMTMTHKRSELLEKISANRSIDELMRDICLAVPELLPGAHCRYVLDQSQLSPMLSRLLHGQQTALEGEHILCQMPLAGSSGEIVGHLVLWALQPASISSSESREVCTMAQELAVLAIHQGELYEGLIHHSNHDVLTNLPNRRYCDIRLARALERAKEQAITLAVLYIDIDHFKAVNDKCGHKTGDLYLQEISSRLRLRLRANDTLARIGGDEFLVILENTSRHEAEVLMQRLSECFTDTFELEVHSIEGSASFGLACYPLNGTTAEELKRFADQEMYLAKRMEDGRLKMLAPEISIFTPAELSLALKRGQFVLKYQPQFSSTGQLTGIEALLRLEDPILGSISPDAFISVAERDDVIVEIGKWVLETALADAARWRFDEDKKAVIVVNVAPRQLEQPGFSAMVVSTLRRFNMPASRLEIELTERCLLADCERNTKQLASLREAGVRVSLDDFGTGQSSLSMLHRLPIDTVKIDRSFVMVMEKEPRVLPVIRAILLMTRKLGMRVVAEGVEEGTTIAKLLRMGRMDFQGYVLSRPVTSEVVAAHLSAWKKGIRLPVGDVVTETLNTEEQVPRPESEA